MGATPRWMGYVSVDDVAAAADRLTRLGGSVYVAPTSSNIGRISVIADPQNATLALVEGMIAGQQKPPEPNKPGRVGWHELLAADHQKAFAFYGELFGWQKAGAESGSTDVYQVIHTGESMIGGMFNKAADRPGSVLAFLLQCR